jgi:hypothetical protein
MPASTVAARFQRASDGGILPPISCHFVCFVVAAPVLQLAVRWLSGLIPPRMSMACQIVVCGSIVPDPLQTLEPVTGPNVTIPAFDNIS